MFLQAALNGGRGRNEHPNIPMTPQQIASEIGGVLAAGAQAVHFHVRGLDGNQSLTSEDLSRTLTIVRAAYPSLAIGISTSEAIEPDAALRYQRVSAWEVPPDYVSVNLNEVGAIELMRLMFARGIGVEAGIWSPEAAQTFVASGLGDDCLRILIEATEDDVAEARTNVKAIQAVLDEGQLKPPRLIHGAGGSAWAIFEEAIAQGYDTRVGFEDMLTLPDGTAVQSNADIVRYAVGRIQVAEKNK